MKRLNLVFILMGILVVSFIIQSDAEAQYVVKHCVFGNGGSIISNDDYQMGATVGQSIIGVTSNGSYTNSIGFWYLSSDYLTSVDPMSNLLPAEYWLGQNYPNPFNPTTTIRFGLPRRSHTTLKLFDLLGRETLTLMDAQLKAGEHEVVLNAQDISSGVYIYRIQAENFVQTRRLVLLK